jgi:flagellin
MVLSNAQDAAAAAPALADAVGTITQGLAFLGGLQSQVDGSKTMNTAIIGALVSGVGSLVDADMNDVSTRMSALQTQQQLGIQALSIANDNAASILKLFAG